MGRPWWRDLLRDAFPPCGITLAYAGNVAAWPTQARRAHTLAKSRAAVAPHNTCTPDRYASIGGNVTHCGRNHPRVITYAAATPATI
ncbi:MAG: hypothetical protein RL153_1502, partial [Verrucomicrobiota bacterium]